jgi:hypothetical protein
MTVSAGTTGTFARETCTPGSTRAESAAAHGLRDALRVSVAAAAMILRFKICNCFYGRFVVLMHCST